MPLAAKIFAPRRALPFYYSNLYQNRKYMNAAAERLLGISPEQIQELAKDILFGQLRLVIATMTIEEINSDRDKFLDNISKNVDSELKKIGLKLISINVTDIKDESGYIEALGKEAAAKAINEAKISAMAEQEKIGETGKALADRERYPNSRNTS